MTDDGSEGVPPGKFAPEPVESEIGETPDREYTNFYFPPEGASLIFTFTQAVFQKIQSALRNGSMMTYGTEGPAVYWEFIKQVDYPVVICEAIIDCIENDTDVQEAIVDMLGDNEEFRDFLSDYIDEHPTGSIYEKNRPIPETTKLTTNGGCNLDILWSQCRGIVETANTFVVDFIEKWELYTNKGEVVSDMVNAVPMLAELAQASGITGILEYANDLVDSIGENYTGDYDETYEITLACELFCAAQLHEDCRLTIKDVFDILHARVGDSLSLGNVTELIVSLTDQDITGINVADLYLFFFFAAMQIGNILLPDQFGFETYIKIITVINEPNDDWMTLCEACEPPETCFAFSIDEQGWTAPTPGDAQYDTGTGWGQENNTYLTIDSPQDGTTIHSVKIKFNRAWTGSSDYEKFFVNLYNWGGAGNFQTTLGDGLAVGDEITIVNTTGTDWTDLRVQVAAGGYTFPPNVNAPTPIYITEVCYDPA